MRVDGQTDRVKVKVNKLFLDAESEEITDGPNGALSLGAPNDDNQLTMAARRTIGHIVGRTTVGRLRKLEVTVVSHSGARTCCISSAITCKYLHRTRLAPPRPVSYWYCGRQGCGRRRRPHTRARSRSRGRAARCRAARCRRVRRTSLSSSITTPRGSNASQLVSGPRGASQPATEPRGSNTSQQVRGPGTARRYRRPSAPTPTRVGALSCPSAEQRRSAPCSLPTRTPHSDCTI